MDTTIQVSGKLRDFLQKRKISKSESYESVIWDALEDSRETSEETKMEIEQARKDYAQGKYKKFSDFKKELEL